MFTWLQKDAPGSPKRRFNTPVLERRPTPFRGGVYRELDGAGRDVVTGVEERICRDQDLREVDSRGILIKSPELAVVNAVLNVMYSEPPHQAAVVLNLPSLVAASSASTSTQAPTGNGSGSLSSSSAMKSGGFRSKISTQIVEVEDKYNGRRVSFSFVLKLSFLFGSGGEAAHNL